MSILYSDPRGGTVESVVTWEIHEGTTGLWSRCKTFDEEQEARGWLARRCDNCPHEALRLVRVETIVTRSVEEEITASA